MNIKQRVEVLMGKSKQSWESGKADAADGRFDSAVNRYYYSCFQVVAALMTLRQLSTSKHTHVRAFVNRDLGMKGHLSSECARMYNKLMDLRQDADYSSEDCMTYDDVQSIEASIEEFHKSVSLLINKDLGSLPILPPSSSFTD